MILAVLYLWVFQVRAIGIVYLPKNMIFSWKFVKGSSVAFELRIPFLTYSSYDYVGIGFKQVDDISGMYYADIVNIKFGEPIEDCYAPHNGIPQPDLEANGNFDLNDYETTANAEGIKVKWNRFFTTNDPNDLEFVVGGQYRLMWALGLIDEVTGLQLRHTTKDRGTVDITLTDDFYDDQFKISEFLSVS